MFKLNFVQSISVIIILYYCQWTICEIKNYFHSVYGIEIVCLFYCYEWAPDKILIHFAMSPDFYRVFFFQQFRLNSFIFFTEFCIRHESIGPFPTPHIQWTCRVKICILMNPHVYVLRNSYKFIMAPAYSVNVPSLPRRIHWLRVASKYAKPTPAYSLITRSQTWLIHLICNSDSAPSKKFSKSNATCLLSF